MSGQWEGLVKIFSRNLSLKLLALGLSLFLWYHISRTGSELLTLTLPVTVTNLPAHLEVNQTTPDHVTITLKGPPGMGQRIHPERLFVLLDATGFHPGRRFLRLDGKNVTLPPGISVMRFSPSTLSLRILSLSRREIPVVPQFIGETRNPITPLSLRVSPRKAEVEGDRALLSRIAFIKTEPIELSSLGDRNIEKLTVGLVSPDPSHFRILSPKTVTVEISRPVRSH
ncbi:MAG: CdaR family protein [Leptospirillia bacterium]|jgi:hypothetical protein